MGSALRVGFRLANGARSPPRSRSPLVRAHGAGLVEELFLTSVGKHINLAASSAIKQAVSRVDPLLKRMLLPTGSSRASEEATEPGTQLAGPVMSLNI